MAGLSGLAGPSGLSGVFGGGLDWYVDSVSGNDANTGKSPNQAFQTIAALEAAGIAASDKIGLAQGSHWREQLDITVNNVMIQAYGSGALPILDASNVAPNASFAKTGGRVNVYEIAITPEWDLVGDWLNTWEDDAFLVRASDVANCDATAGSYYPSGAAGAITLYVHASDSSDVRVNGKVYEYSHRQAGIAAVTANNLTLENVVTQRNLNEGGSCRCGRSGILTGCSFLDGSKHNLTVRDGSAVNTCTLNGAYYGVIAASLAVYNEDSPASLGVTFAGCTFEMDTYSALISGIEGHFNVGGDFGTVLVNECTFDNLSGGISCGDYTAINITDCIFDEVGLGVRVEEAVTCTIQDCTLTASANDSRLVASGVAGCTIVVTDCRAVVADPSTSGIIFANHDNTTINVSGSYLEGTALGATDGIIFINSGKVGCSFSVNNSSIVCNTGSNYRSLANPVTYVGDNNCFDRGGGQPRFNYNGSTYTTLGDWQTATSEDGSSTVGGCT